MADARRTNTNNNTFNKGRGKLRCSHCNENNHTVDRCFHLHGFPLGHKFHKKGEKAGTKSEPSANNTQLEIPSFTQEQYQQLLAFLNNGNTQPKANVTSQFVPSSLSSKVNSTYSNKWVIDSGATDHITSSLELLHKISPSPYSSIALPNGNKVPIDAIGSVQFGSNLSLSKVLHVPSFCVNLLSVSKMTKYSNCSITFFPDFCFLPDLATKKTIGLGRQCDGLYYLSTNTTSPLNLVDPKVNQTSLQPDLWHRRLGHPSIQPLKHLADSILKISFVPNKVCDICHLAKQTRLPFGLSSISTSEPFEMIPCDIWGAFRVSSLSGAYYFLTIVDDFSRHTWVYLMRFKSETQSLLKSFFAYVTTQFNHVSQHFNKMVLQNENTNTS